MKKPVFMGATKVDAARTIGEISVLLQRAGATSITTEFGAGGKVEAVRFGLRVAGVTDPVNFRLPCRTAKLVTLLKRDIAQAERTGWRQVMRWVEAQLAMVDVGMVQMLEVFMPYAVIGTGQTMFEVWESQQKLLAAPTGEK